MIGFDWLFLFLILIGLAYAAWVIKKEKKTFLENPISYKIGPFLLYVPKWWSPINDEKNQLLFERKDTKYEWVANFTLIRKPSDFINLDRLLIDFVKEKKILFDPESTDINFKKNLNDLELIEVGGTATQDEIERIYYEIAFLKSNKYILICESKSSVLNGAVEGPYFEEVVKRIKLS